MKDIFGDDAFVARMKAVLGSFAKAGDINLCVLDILGNPIVYPTNDCAFCKRVRASEKGRAQCIRYASHAILESMREKRTYFYKCPFGLVDFVIPVFHDGRFLGAVCGGQVRSSEAESKVDYAYPSALGEAHGAPVEELGAIFDRMPDHPAEKLFETVKIIEFFTDELSRFNTVIELSRKGETDELAIRERLRPALAYIAEHFTEHISIVDMARMCHMSENYFSRMFGRLTGRTFPGYVTDLRLTKAKELLLEGDAKIGRVAYEVGYDDPAYFVRKFKAHTGMTPSEWQKYKQSEK